MKDLIPKCDYVRAIHHVHNMHKIGEKYPHVLKPEEEFLKSLLKNPQLKSFAQPALEFIAGLRYVSASLSSLNMLKDWNSFYQKIVFLLFWLQTRSEKRTDGHTLIKLVKIYLQFTYILCILNSNCTTLLNVIICYILLLLYSVRPWCFSLLNIVSNYICLIHFPSKGGHNYCNHSTHIIWPNGSYVLWNGINET